jgi:hypothetical protein
MSVAIVTRYLGPTTYRGARIVASVPCRIADCDPREAAERPSHRPAHWRLTVPYPYELGPGMEAHRPAAMALAARLEWFGTWFGGALDNGYAFVLASEPFALHRPERAP